MKWYDKISLFYYYIKARRITSHWKRKEIDDYQQKKIKQHLVKSCKHSPFFREIQKSGKADTLSSFPITEKRTLMEHFDTWNTAGVTKKECLDIAMASENSREFSPMIGNMTVGLSSGTSGNRGIFLVSPKERAMWAGTILGKTLPDGLFAKEKIAFFLRANSNLYETVKSRTLSFHFLDLMKEEKELLQQLQTIQPTILIAPPSMLQKISKNIRKGRVLLSFVKRIYAVAEILEESVKEELERTFNQPIYQVYQATEGFLGVSCEHGTIHLNEDIVHIEKEYIDEEQTRFYPIITDFKRDSQPIIRYRLNDILVEKKEPCPCGSHYMGITKIEGRSDDIFVFEEVDGKEKEVFPDFIRKWFYGLSHEIYNFKVIQESKQKIHIHLDVKEEWREQVILELEHQIEEFQEEFHIQPFHIEFLPPYEEERGRKIRRVESKIKR